LYNLYETESWQFFPLFLGKRRDWIIVSNLWWSLFGKT